MTFLKKYQTYDINNKIDMLKNINKTFPKGVNFKDLSLVECESLIGGQKSYNKLASSQQSHSVFTITNNSTSLTGSASETDSNLKIGQNNGVGPINNGTPFPLGRKIAKLFSRFNTASSSYANKIHNLTADDNINLLNSSLSNMPASSDVPKGRGGNKNLLNNRSYVNSLTSSGTFSFQSQNNNTNIKYENFQFKKATYNKFIFAMEKATNILNLAFKSSGCLISKPIFTITYKGSPDYAPINKGTDSLSLGRRDRLNNGIPSGAAANFKVNIHLFYYIKKEYRYNDNLSDTGLLAFSGAKFKAENKKYYNILSIINDKLLYLSDYLTKLFNTDIEIELVRLYKPYQDSNILVQQLNSESYNKKFIRIISRLFKTINIYKNKGFINSAPAAIMNNSLPFGTWEGGIDSNSMLQDQEDSNLNLILGNKVGANVSFPSRISGLNIKLAGRTIKERVIPRLTVKRAQRGTLNRLNAKLIEKSMFTDKSRKGAFNFTVTLSHIFK